MVGLKILPLNFKVNSESKESQGTGRLVGKMSQKSNARKALRLKVKGRGFRYDRTSVSPFNNRETES